MSLKIVTYALALLTAALGPPPITSLATSFLILIWLASRVKPVYAYEDYTHWGLTAVAVSKLRGTPNYTSLKEVNRYLGPVESIEKWFSSQDQTKRSIINSAGDNFSSWKAYVKSIPPGTQGLLWGSIAEDYLGDGGDIDLAIVQNHYYNPVTKGGLNDWEGAKDYGNIIGDMSLGNLAKTILASNPGSATARAQRHWDHARKAYVHGSIRDAYTLLGRVVHLLEDMTEPAHTRNDNHLGAIKLGFFTINFPEKNDHLYWTIYEKWCDSVPTPINKDSAGKPHPFMVAVDTGKGKRRGSQETGLRKEYREELARNPELLRRYREELQAGKLHLDFMVFGGRNGWMIPPGHDSDKSNEFYFKMAKGGLMMGEAIQSHNTRWMNGHHSPETNNDNVEEKVADQWSVVLRAPMIRDRWIQTGRIPPTATMKEFLEAFQKEGYYLNTRRGDVVQPEAQETLDKVWVEGYSLADSYLRVQMNLDPEKITVAAYLEKVQKVKTDSQEPSYARGEVRKYFPHISSDFRELFNDSTYPSSWSLLWGRESQNMRDRQVSGDSVNNAYRYASVSRVEDYLKELAIETASKWFSEDTIPGNLTCPSTYPELQHLLGESEEKTTKLVDQGLLIDAWEYLKDSQGNKLTGEIIRAEMEKAENAWTRAGREETYSNYPFIQNTIFPEDKDKNLWQLLYRRRYRFALDYVKEIAMDRFPRVTELASALIQGFYDSVRHVDILRDGEEKDADGAWRNNLITVEKQEGDEDKWIMDLWVENCGGVKEDINVRIGEVPEGWRIEVAEVEGCSGVEGGMVERVWVGVVKDVEPTPEEVSNRGGVGSPWFFEGLLGGQPYDPPFGVRDPKNRGAKITVEVHPPKKS